MAKKSALAGMLNNLGKKISRKMTSNNQENLHDNPEMQEDTAVENQQEVDNSAEAKEQENQELNAENEKTNLSLELEQMNDKYLRLLSEFDNFKRRTAKERIELYKTASKDLIVELLGVMDDFERGLATMETAQDLDAIKVGVNLTYQKLKTTLENKGLQPITAVGEAFDTDLHEAISKAPAQDEESKNKILMEVEKGYRLNDHVIRFSKVIVGV